jgi:hypothetical protein
VQKIATAEDANRYLRKLGLEDADLRPGDRALSDPSPSFYRGVVQAVADVAEKFPALLNGRYTKLGGVRLTSQFPEDKLDSGIEQAWAVTGPLPSDRWRWDMVDYDLEADGEPPLPPEAMQYVVINDTVQTQYGFDNDDVDMARGASGLAVADRTVYGRTVHELGHALAWASGQDPENSDDEAWGGTEQALNEARVPMSGMAKISGYGTSNVVEAWAEIFTTLHTPGAYDWVVEHAPETKKPLDRLRGHKYKGQVIM